MSNFSCNLTRNIIPHSMKNLAVHSLLSWQMIILPILITLLIRSSFEGLGECMVLAFTCGTPGTVAVPGCPLLCARVHEAAKRCPEKFCNLNDEWEKGRGRTTGSKYKWAGLQTSKMKERKETITITIAITIIIRVIIIIHKKTKRRRKLRRKND